MSHEPREPEQEPVGEPDPDAAWREIVDNFGDRAEVDEAFPDEESYASDVPDATIPDAEQVDDRFVPPPPPPIPRTTTDRLLAYVGVFGAPTVLLVLVIFSVQPPQWVFLSLVAAFVAGFVYLVWRLPRGPRDPWDDGAVV